MSNTEETLNAIRAALPKLDVDNDDHWTNDGLPALETVHHLTGNQRVKRADVTNAAPDFNRDKAREVKAEQERLAAAPPEAGEAQAPTADEAEDQVDAPEAAVAEGSAIAENEIDEKIAELEAQRVDTLKARDAAELAIKDLDRKLGELLDLKIQLFPAPSPEEVALAYIRGEHQRRADYTGLTERVKAQLKDIIGDNKK